MLWSIKTLAIITYITALRYVHYPIELLMAALNRFTTVAMVTLFWFIVARNSDVGVEVLDLVGYFLIVSGLSQLMLGGLAGASAVHKRIMDGSLNAYLIRPMHPFFYLYYQQVGYLAPFFFLSFFLIFLGVSLSANLATISIPLIVLTFVCAYAINVSFNILIGSIGFYVVEASGIKNAFGHIIYMSQGFLIPIFLTPQWWQNYVFASPFAASLYNPIRAFQGEHLETWYLISGAVWALVLIPVSLRVWKRAIRQYEGVGI